MEAGEMASSQRAQSNPAEARGAGGIDTDRKRKLLFMMLVQQHQQIVLSGLGVDPPASGGLPERDLSSARFAMDTLMMLKEYTAAGIPSELAEYLNTVLDDLRKRFRDLDGEEAASNSPEEGRHG
jgi:hypothetical protein